jgi:hypothetical protein
MHFIEQLKASAGQQGKEHLNVLCEYVVSHYKPRDFLEFVFQSLFEH